MVALSFAGEDREYVETVANILEAEGITVFYDNFKKSDLWGKDLYDYLNDIYQNKAGFVIMFLSKHYADKAWTTHERKAAQAREFIENREYILPVRFDDTEIAGINITKGFLDARGMHPQELVSLFKEKLIDFGMTIPVFKNENNYDLIKSACDFIKELDREIDDYKKTVNQLDLFEFNLSMEERNRIFSKKSQVENWFIQSYNKKFLSQSIAIKDELINRLNIRDRDPFKDSLYYNPLNSHGIEDVSCDLKYLYERFKMRS